MCYQFPFSVFCTIGFMLSDIHNWMVSFMPVGEWMALFSAILILFVLLCVISLLSEQRQDAQNDLKQAQNAMYPTWQGICESALQVESQQEYYIAAYSENH